MRSMMNYVGTACYVVAGEGFHRGAIDVLLRVLDTEKLGLSQYISTAVLEKVRREAKRRSHQRSSMR